MNNKDLTVIVGLGKTGLSCARYLGRQGLPIAVTDSRNDPPGLAELRAEFPHISISLGGFNESLLAQASQLVVSPGVALKEPAIAKQIARGIPAIGDIELFAQAVKVPVIGITGTNGKSTVTALVGAMLADAGFKVGVGGNLGTPVLDMLPEKDNVYVLELSSFQLETTFSLKLAAATVLNISPDHLDRYPGMAEYIAAKQRIFQNCEIPVINREDAVSFSGLKNRSAAISFGLNTPKNQEFGLRVKEGQTFLAYGEENLLDVNELQIKGRHQMANALAALALGSAFNIPLTSMIHTLKTFPGLPHRCQWVANIENVNWYNDSKGTNVSSSLSGIEGIGAVTSGKIILIAGGLGKQQDFSPLRPAVEKYVRTVLLMGKDAPQIEAALSGNNRMQYVKDLNEAVKTAKEIAQSGDAVLFSPACASFDMFKDFEHRGEVFVDEVRKIMNA